MSRVFIGGYSELSRVGNFSKGTLLYSDVSYEETCPKGCSWVLRLRVFTELLHRNSHFRSDFIGEFRVSLFPRFFLMSNCFVCYLIWFYLANSYFRRSLLIIWVFNKLRLLSLFFVVIAEELYLQHVLRGVAYFRYYRYLKIIVHPNPWKILIFDCMYDPLSLYSCWFCMWFKNDKKICI